MSGRELLVIIEELAEAVMKTTERSVGNDRALLELTKVLIERVLQIEARVNELELLTKKDSATV